ncbi:MAG: 8-amino-7-oxononanoate synthase [Candidatus Dadabacteria bacterium]|nr:8-amino-7-oxononanoate synthase [Candidatus Dadabacteria bacterium]NIV42238.1 8-amino-7-oxononanoate synthase [Candidatus Dadabacteria bacterium]NIX15330.1 8-amino-7-oxononanoate synthase [Candidatus Dadabacteria bacterium]
MADSLSWIEKELDVIKDKDLFRILTELESAQSPEIIIDGKKYILLSSNSYLGLTVEPRVIQAAVEATEKYGTGSGGSRLVSGSTDLHRQLEQRLAYFKKTEAAILFSTGYLANIGTISTLIGKDDVIYSDELNHASIIDGCRLSRADIKIYRHLDINHLESLLEKDKNRKCKKLIVTDTVFSMDGDLAPLPEIADLADKYGCMFMIDEAHSTGVLGKRGSGGTEHFGIEDRVPIVMGTLSKAVGSLGGYIAGSQKLIDFIRNRVRSYIFDTSLPAASLAASLTAIDIIEHEPERREYLWKLINKFKTGLDDIGLTILPSHSAVIPVLIGDAQPTLDFAKSLRENGVYTPAVRPPSVPDGMCRIRATLMAKHTEDQIDHALKAFKLSLNN